MKKNYMRIEWPKWKGKEWHEVGHYVFHVTSAGNIFIGLLTAYHIFADAPINDLNPLASCFLILVGLNILYWLIVGIIRLLHFRLYIEDKKK